MADLVVRMLGDTRAAVSALDRMKSRLSQSSSTTSGLGKMAGVAGLAIGGVLVAGMASAVNVAMQGQVAQAALNTAIKSTHQSVQASMPAINGATSAGRNLGFANDDSRAALARLEIATRSTKVSIIDLGVAENLARARHLSLAAAAQMLAMAMTGSQRAAKQLGIVVIASTKNLDALKAAHKGSLKGIDSLTIAHAKLADKLATGQEVVRQVSERTRGQALAFSKTAAGGAAKFHAQMLAVEESLGVMLLPAIQTAIAWISRLTTWMSNHRTIARVMVISLGVLTAGLLIFSGVMMAVNIVMAMNPIGLIIIGVAAVVVAVIYAYTHFRTFRDVVNGIFQTYVTAIMTIVTLLTTTIPNGIRSILSWFRSNWPIIATVIAGPFAPVVALATNGFGIRTALHDDIVGSPSLLTGVQWLCTYVVDFVKNLIPYIGSALASVVTGGLIGRGGFGGSHLNISRAISFAKSQMGLPYVWGGGHGGNAFGKGWDCSGFATTAATMIPGYTGGIGTTYTAYPASTSATGREPVLFGFTSFSPRGGLEMPGHMGIRLAGTWYQFGNPGHTGGSFPVVRVPAGLRGKDYATGGVFMRPVRGTVGEAGPEAIIPLDQFGRASRKQPICITIDGFFGDECELASKVSELVGMCDG